MRKNKQSVGYAPNETRGQDIKTHGSLLVKIFCVFAAFCMWVYVMMVDSPDKVVIFKDVKVVTEEIETWAKQNEMSIYNVRTKLVDVTLSGTKRALSNLASENITVVAKADDQQIDNRADSVYNFRLELQVPDGCRKEAIYPGSVEIEFDVQADISKNLSQPKQSNIKMQEGCYVGDIVYGETAVRLTGPARLLSQIAEATVDLDMTGVNSTFTKSYPVVLLDKFGNRLDLPNVECRPTEIDVTVYVVKTVQVPVEVVFTQNYFSSENCTVTCVPDVITVEGDPGVIDAGDLIESIRINDAKDMKDLFLNKTVRLKTAEGVVLSASEVELTIEADSSIRKRVITVPGENIKDTGGVTGVQYDWDVVPMDVTVAGPVEAISNISPEDITIRLKMSPYDGSNTGTVTVPAEIIIDSEYKNQVIALGEYKVLVTIYG